MSQRFSSEGQTSAPPTEAADPAPTYLVSGSESAARLVAGDGLSITLRNCLD